MEHGTHSSFSFTITTKSSDVTLLVYFLISHVAFNSTRWLGAEHWISWLWQPFVSALERGPFAHNHWRRPMLTFRCGVPTGFCRRCKCVPCLSNGFTCIFPLAVCVIVVVNSVCCRTTLGGVGRGGIVAPTAEPQGPRDNGLPGQLWWNATIVWGKNKHK